MASSAAPQLEKDPYAFRSDRFFLAGIVLLAVVAIGWLVVVSGHHPYVLTRSAAAEAIKSNFTFQADKSIFINVGKMPRYVTADGGDYDSFEGEGYIRRNNGKTVVTLTPAGEKLLKDTHADYIAQSKDNPAPFWAIPVASRKLNGVTGITTHDNVAEVEFSWHWKFTQFGERFKADDYTSQIRAPQGTTLLSADNRYNTAVFRKWDDGWRLEKISGIE